MKSHLAFVFCILCLLVSSIISGQIVLPFRLQPNAEKFKEVLPPNASRMTDPPMLRLSQTGPMGLEEIKIELIPLTLTPSGPIISFRGPDPEMPASGLLTLLPNSEGTPLKLSNLGPLGYHGIRMNIARPPVMMSFFDVFYDINMGTETHVFGDPDFDLSVVRTFDKATPKLHEAITTGHPLFADSFFDVFYDFSLASHGTGFGFFPDNICWVTTYDPATPKLLHKVTSNLPAVQSFFDITYDLDLGRETHRLASLPGDPDFDLLAMREYDKSTPKLLERISSSDPSLVNSFFDVTYDLELAAIGTGFGNSPSNICYTTMFDPMPPTLIQKVSSGLPTTPTFFDITYDLTLGRETHRLGAPPGDPDFDLLIIREYDRATPKLLERISSSDPSLANSFFDITYDLGARTAKIHLEDLIVTRLFDSTTPKLGERIHSSLLPYLESFFDITYDLDLGIHKTEFQDLICSMQYRESDWDFSTHISSDMPAIPSFFDITYDIGLADMQTHSTKASVTGIAPLEMRYEYDALNRRIREVCLDESSGTLLTVERRLTPSGSALAVGGDLMVNGGVVGSESGPLAIVDDVQVIGFLTVNGGLNVVGPKMFKIDHPLDPDHKYLVHSCIESPDMMNIYNGNAITDEQGYVTIKLPDYFETLNTDFRYQLTCIGVFAQAIVDQKIKDNKFVIHTDKPNVEVSWQVTGIRQDPASKRGIYTVEMEKEPEMIGKRLYQP